MSEEATFPITEQIKDLQFQLQRSARYHRRRQRFHDRLHAIASGVAVIFGTGTFVSLMSDAPVVIAQTCALVVAVFAAADLVIGFARNSWTHADLASRYLLLERNLMLVAEPADEIVRQTHAAKRELEAQSPPTLKVLNALSYNETLTAFGFSADHPQRFAVGRFQRFLAPVWDWNEGQLISGPHPTTGRQDNGQHAS